MGSNKMDFMELLKTKAKARKKKIVLPETTDERILKAAHLVLKEELAKIILIGNKEAIFKDAKKLKCDLEAATIIDPTEPERLEAMANHYFERRKHKGATIEMAKRIMLEEPVYAGSALVGMGLADGMVAGAITPTPKVIKAALYCVGLAPGISLVSSYFVMIVPDKSFGEDGVLFFADSGVNPCPSSEQLADIAKSTADSFKNIMGAKPKVAMLSFSTKGSANHPDVQKVIAAVNMAKLKYPDLLIDGELQLDAAVVPEVAARKCPDSPVAGQANVLIFPDLDAGNIGYKLVERFAKAKAFGPILQGLAKPVNDLSRGASVEDIVNVIEITELLAEK